MVYNYYGNYSEQNQDSYKLAQEEDFVKICNYLKTVPIISNKITFEVFDSRESKQKADPHHSISRASARFGEMTIYRVWTPDDDPHFPHETTHLVAHTWAKPYYWEVELDTFDNKKIKKNIEMVSTSYMQEGLAIAVDDIVFGRKLLEDGEYKLVDDWCKEQIHKMPSLTQVINLNGFASFENKIVVPFAASFSKFLLQTYGLEKYKEMYIELNENKTAEENIKLLEHVYKLKNQDLFDQWKERLN